MTLGAAFLLVRFRATGAIDRSMAAGYAVMVVLYVLAAESALSDTRRLLADALLRS